jgi:hypothetical protein
MVEGNPMKICLPFECLSESDKRVKDCARACHETVNRHFKEWGCLHETYRHDLKHRSTVFGAVVVIKQLTINKGETLFACMY